MTGTEKAAALALHGLTLPPPNAGGWVIFL